MNLMVDTWAWLGALDAGDPDHARASAALRDALAGPDLLHTTDYILAETITLLFRRLRDSRAPKMLRRLQTMLRTTPVLVERISAERFDSALRMRLFLDDKPDISFTDLATAAVMQELRITAILTADRHFAQVNLGFRLVPAL